MSFTDTYGFNPRAADQLAIEILNSNGVDPFELDICDSLGLIEGQYTIHQKNLILKLVSRIRLKNLNWSQYTSSRLSLYFDENLLIRHPRMALKELLARFYYDLSFSGNIDPQVFNSFSYPPLLQIEIASYCNYRCIFCYQTDETFSGKESTYMGFMDLDVFKRLIDECVDNVPYVTFASRGEPTLHPNFSEMLHYCEGKFLDIKINTNASLLTQDKVAAILNVCDTVVFSIDTPDKDEYSTIRVNGDFERVINNINMFNQQRLAHPRSRKIKTRASGVYFDESRQDFKENQAFFSPFVDEVAFVKYDPWEKLYQFDSSAASNRCCNQPYYRFFVWHDASFNCCDMDYKSHLCSKDDRKIGSDLSLSEAWNSPIMNEIRSKHYQGSRSSLYPCNICPYPNE